MAHADVALQTLTCSDLRVPELLEKLEELNLVRRKSTQNYFELAESAINTEEALLLYVSETIDHGVI